MDFRNYTSFLNKEQRQNFRVASAGNAKVTKLILQFIDKSISLMFSLVILGYILASLGNI